MIEWIARLEPQHLLVGIALLGLALALPLEIAAFRRLRRVQLVRGTLFLLTGGVVILLGLAGALLAAGLHGYARLTYEQEAAQVSIRQVAERRYSVSVVQPAEPARVYDVNGDEWQIDARLLKWRAIGTVLGFDTVYRLERLSGRYADIETERTASRTVYALSQNAGTPDLWALVRRYHDVLPLADALYGSAAYVPLADGAEYEVTVSASGLVVRPRNDTARKATTGWR